MVKTPQNKALTNAQAKAIKAQRTQLEAIKATERALKESPPEPPENVFLQAINGVRPLNIDVPFTDKLIQNPLPNSLFLMKNKPLEIH